MGILSNYICVIFIELLHIYVMFKLNGKNICQVKFLIYMPFKYLSLYVPYIVFLLMMERYKFITINLKMKLYCYFFLQCKKQFLLLLILLKKFNIPILNSNLIYNKLYILLLLFIIYHLLFTYIFYYHIVFDILCIYFIYSIQYIDKIFNYYDKDNTYKYHYI